MTRVYFATAFAAALILASAPAAAADDFHFREYTYGASSCTGIKDPMNFYFGRSLGTLDAATDAIANVVKWSATPAASDQWFWDDGACQKQDRQRAEFAFATEKHHTRLNQGRWIDPQFTHITASPMHHDAVTWCGDVADSFNSSRDVAAQRIQARAGWFAVYTWTGNNAAIRQCDGRFTASDGYYVLARN
jgi:hypothetical protein